VITLKSELAGKLIDRDPERAGKEIREVERSRARPYPMCAMPSAAIARKVWRRNWRKRSRRSKPQASDRAMRCGHHGEAPAMQESVLSLAVREAVTNVVRHAQARTCRMRLEQQNGSCRLEIHDDGRGHSSAEGNGLRGMRERVEMLGGTLQRRNRCRHHAHHHSAAEKL
jgi:two-component system sensor histidine kinase DesK